MGVEHVLEPKRRRWYRRKMPRGKIVKSVLEGIPGAAIAAARTAKTGMNTSQYAERLGINQQTLQRIEAYIPEAFSPKTMIKSGPTKELVIKSLGLYVDNAGLQPYDVDAMTDSGRGKAQTEGGARFDLPLYKPRLADGGTFMALSGVAAHIRRPDFLAGIKEAYAIEMIDDSMSPKYEQGDWLYVNPQATPEVGKCCTFLTIDRANALVRKLVGATAEAWHVSGVGRSDSVMEISKSDWPLCEAVEGTHTPHRK